MFLLSAGLVMVYSLMQILGWFVLPFGFAKGNSFNTIGTMVSLSIFCALALIYVQWLWLSSDKTSKTRSVAYTVMTVIGLLLMYFVNSFVGWVVLSLGLIVMLALALVNLVNNNSSPTWFWKPLVVLVIGILFVAFQFLPNSVNPRRLVSVNLPTEIQLSSSANMEMVKNAMSERPVLGYGPGTTGIAFGTIKPETLNKSIVWNLNFDRPAYELATVMIETGLLGLLVFEALSILFLIYGLMFLLKRHDHPGYKHAMGLYVVWVAVYAAHFFYSYNTTFYFLYWMLLALFMAITHFKEQGAEQPSSITTSPRSALSWMFVSLLVLAVLMVGGFFQATVYSGEVAYANGLKELGKQQPDFVRVNSSFTAAIDRVPYRDTYWISYGQNLLFLAAQEAAKPEPNIRTFQAYVANAVAAANRAKDISPAKASNWSVRAQFFGDLRSLAIPGSDDVIIASWQEALNRDGRNPAIMIRLAQAYLNASESIDPKIVGSGTDADADGLFDARETELGSDPKNSDTNGNSVLDGDEVKAGFNPAGAGRLTFLQLQPYMSVDVSKLVKAEEFAKKSIETKDDLVLSYMTLAKIYEKWQKFDLVQEQLNLARGKFPGNVEVKYELGRTLFNQQKYAEAEKLFKEVLKAVPNYSNAHYSMGLIYLQRADRQNALAEFEKTREIAGPNIELEKLINQLKELLAQPQANP
jgi:hypothetical protein